MLVRRIRYNPQTAINIKLRNREKIVDIGKIFILFIIWYVIISSLYKVLFLDVENKSEVLVKALYLTLSFVGFYCYIYFSIIIGFFLSIIALPVYFLSCFFYGELPISSGLVGMVIILLMMLYYTFIRHEYFDGTPFRR